MDIPVPKDTAENIEAAKTDVPEASSQSEPTAVVEKPKEAPGKETELLEAQERQKKIAELIESKQYFLGIKEKHARRLLTANGSTRKKSKKTKKKTAKKQDAKSKKPASKNKTTLQVVALVVLLLGFVVAIDAGFLDIGLTLPFDIIK